MIILLDTDVLIDIALNRMPHAEHSAKLLDATQAGDIQSWIAWHSLANFYYIVSSESQHKLAIQFIDELLKFTKVAETKTADALFAVRLNISDFEDALQIAAAMSCKAQYILTRNIKHYKRSPIPAFKPVDFLKSTLRIC